MSDSFEFGELCRFLVLCYEEKIMFFGVPDYVFVFCAFKADFLSGLCFPPKGFEVFFQARVHLIQQEFQRLFLFSLI